MSYRSSMVLCIKKQRFNKLKVINKPFPDIFKQEFRKCGDTYDPELLYFFAEDLKMYSDYQEVQDFHKWLDEVVCEDNYHFIRTGEEQDDVEELGGLQATCDTDLYASTIITLPGGSL